MACERDAERVPPACLYVDNRYIPDFGSFHYKFDVQAVAAVATLAGCIAAAVEAVFGPAAELVE